MIATGVIALLFRPLQQRVRRGVNRLIYGQRDEPYTVLSQLGKHLETTLSPEAVLPTIVETVSQALKLPYVAITLEKGHEINLAAAIGNRMIDFFNTMRPTKAPDVFPELTEREREVLSLIAQGFNNSTIAEKLVISPKTVHNHITNILSKLQVVDRAEAIIKARRAGLG
ncbi:MAG: response regulator transcription factor [Anaerolineales bacterium]|nr:response regulator transcription factor [Anaerolineales bacterium]